MADRTEVDTADKLNPVKLKQVLKGIGHFLVQGGNGKLKNAFKFSGVNAVVTKKCPILFKIFAVVILN